MTISGMKPGWLIQCADAEKTSETRATEVLEGAIPRESSKRSVEGADHEDLLVLPTYNAAQWLPDLVLHLLQQGPFDLLIVDDRSPDGTGEIAEQLALLFPGRVDLLHQPERLGREAAYRAGRHYALARGYRRLFALEGDGRERPFPLPRLHAVLHESTEAPRADTQRPPRSRSFWYRWCLCRHKDEEAP